MKNLNTTAERYYILSGVYADKDLADKDINEVRHAYEHSELKEYAAVEVRKDEKGKMHVHQASSNAKQAAGAGIAIGALPAFVVAIVVPPAGAALLGAGVIAGASLGGIFGSIGHYRNGVSKDALQEVADHLETGETGVVIVARENVEGRLSNLLQGASSRTMGELHEEDTEAVIHDLFPAVEESPAQASTEEKEEELLTPA